MYALRKVGFYITLVTLVGGALSVLFMLILGVGLGNGDNVFGAIVGIMLAIIAVACLIGVGIIVILMIFYQKSIAIPILFLLVFGIASIILVSKDTPVLYVTLGLAIGPFVTIVGYFFKQKQVV